MNEFQVFSHKDLGGIRAVLIDGRPWFVGKDVASILGYENTSRDVNRHVDKEDKGTTEMDTPGGKQTLAVINESGLYSLILSCKLPKAKEFKRWVTSEVLPSIRETGSYFKGNETELLIKTVAESIIRQIPAIVSETVKSMLNRLPESKKSLRLNALDWNEVNYWEGILNEWREFRSKYSDKEAADRDFLESCITKNPNQKIGRRTLYRKWHAFNENGSAGLIDMRGRHGNQKRVVVTVEIEDAGEA